MAVKNTELIPSEDVVAGKMDTWIIRYTVGEEGLPIGGGIRIAFEHGSDWGRFNWGYPQADRPEEPDYVTARTAKTKLKVDAGCVSAVSIIVVKVEDTPLAAGEVIEVILGDKTQGSSGFMCQTVSQRNCEIIVFEDTQGRGEFKKVAPSPTLNIIPDEPVRIQALAKSYNTPGEPISLVIRAEDRYGNVAEGYKGKVEILDAETKTVLEEKQFTPADHGVKRIRDVSFCSEGTKRLIIKDETNNFQVLSNPVVRNRSQTEEKVYWGQIHGHSIVSDGLGTPEEYYEYAKNVSNLDFAALTDHGIWTDADNQTGRQRVDQDLLRHYLDNKSWRAVQSAARKYNQPGEFITLLGYEWCSTRYGDKNVYFYNDDEIIEHPNTPEELYRSLKGRKAMIISHMMKERCVDWDYFDQNMERVVEICSFHGVREYAGNHYFEDDLAAVKLMDKHKGKMVQDALFRGYRLGIVGGSDDHSGKPGSDVRGILRCRINGLCAAVMEELTRENLWEALYNRRCYATTGAKIILRFSLNDFPMGSEITDNGEKRKIFVKVHGTERIKTMEIVKNNNTVYAYTGKGLDEEIEYEDTKERDTDYYYVRVRQEDGQMAWSSPVWIRDDHSVKPNRLKSLS